ncbi:cobalamin biosynthesis protein [Halocynthiibacter namhaensis]|uniref:cobalamin biosynthesis protein n=1 Tax=Halocynthiibacter namhaensis TaxID=1290553 RepID=UPI000579578D|nr:cobalamin biosynthesis protein [Halocynthiibacter namhaensis]
MIVAGIGYRSQTPIASLIRALETIDVVPDLLACGENKRDTDQIFALGKALNLPVELVPMDQLPQQSCDTQSETISARFQTGSYSEACALAAAGEGATLLTPRRVLADGQVTIAIAKGPS